MKETREKRLYYHVCSKSLQSYRFSLDGKNNHTMNSYHLTESSANRLSNISYHPNMTVYLMTTQLISFHWKG